MQNKQSQTPNSIILTDLPDDILPLIMAITGDPGDDVKGVDGIGPKRAVTVIGDVLRLSGGMDQLYDNVYNGNDIFPNSMEIENKYTRKVIESEQNNKTISNNLKLVSFELISRYLEDPPNTETKQKREKLLEIIGSNVIAPLESMREALEKNRVYIFEDNLDILYHGV